MTPHPPPPASHVRGGKRPSWPNRAAALCPLSHSYGLGPVKGTVTPGKLAVANIWAFPNGTLCVFLGMERWPTLRRSRVFTSSLFLGQKQINLFHCLPTVKFQGDRSQSSWEGSLSGWPILFTCSEERRGGDSHSGPPAQFETSKCKEKHLSRSYE